MSYVSFYRKWRPQTFSEIIGQEYIVQTLQNSITKKRISHSYIFCGPRGTGKTSLARIFAKALNCVNGPTPKPCNKCQNCTSIASGTNVDVVEIDAASNRGINEIRDLREQVKYVAVSLRKKVYMIGEVHMLTTEAFNALLKVLEEPPEHVLFIMATTEPHQVIQTIMSRCQRFDFEPVPVEKIRQRISNIALSENITINESALNLIAKYADGSLRDADGILEQLSSLGDSKITADDVTSLLGIIDQEMLFELANILLERNLSQALLFIKRMLSSNLNLKIFTAEFIEHLYGLYVIKNYDNPADILDFSEDYRDSYFNQAGLFKHEELQYLMELFSDLLRQIRWGENAKSFFKATIIKAINYENTDNALYASRIKKIESDISEIKLKFKGEQPGDALNKQNKTEAAVNKTDNSTIVPILKPEIKTDKEIDIKNDEKIPAIVPVEEIEKNTHKVNAGTDKNIQKRNQVNISDDTITSNKAPGEISKDLADKKDDLNEFEIIISNNWNQLQAKLKSKKTATQAMFAEVKNFKVVSNKITFYLDNNKKWHKDHLSIQANLEIIRDIIKEITGKNFIVQFDLLAEDDITKANSVSPEVKVFSDAEEVEISVDTDSKGEITRKENSLNISDKDNKDNKKENGDKTGDIIYDYIEEIFHMKEK